MLEDGVELAGEAVQLVVGQGEPSQAGEVGNLVSGDLRHDSRSLVRREMQVPLSLLLSAQALIARNARARWPCATVLRVPSYLLRVQLEDRPGSLGSVAVALGSVGADILSLDVVERGPGYAIDDLIVDLPPGRDARHADHRGGEPQRGAGGQHPAAHRPARGAPGARARSTTSPRPATNTRNCRCSPTRRRGCCGSAGAPSSA